MPLRINTPPDTDVIAMLLKGGFGKSDAMDAFRLSLVLAVVVVGGRATADAADITPPNERGPFNVGVTTFTSTMSSGRVTTIQIYYPTLEPAELVSSAYVIATSAGSYQIRSPLGAVHDATAAPGLFPLIVHDHGGGAPGADAQRIADLPLHELMATHGLIVAVALHSASAVNRVRDVSLVIDLLLARSASDEGLLSGTIDPDKIGISGVDAGGAAAIGAAAGWAAEGLPGDPRIKAMALYEPSVLSMDDASRIDVPYLVMGGLQSIQGLRVPLLFDTTVDAAPRIYVVSPNATHLNYVTGVCAEIDQTREAALFEDPSLPEPLTTLTLTSAAARRAYTLWNQGETLFPSVGSGAGGGRNFCDRVGVNSIRSLDTSPTDGFTDSPPLMPSDAYTPQPAISAEIMVPLIEFYTVAFWKALLEGDRRYQGFLTPGYAKRNQLAAIVDIE